MEEANVAQPGERTTASAVDVVVVASADVDMALDCLSSLERGGVSLSSVWLVDNASPDGIAGRVRERFPAAEIVRLERPVGYSRACNSGARAGTGEFVLFLNDDVVASDGAVTRLHAALSRAEGAVAAGGRLVDPADLSTQLQYKPKRFPTLSSLATLLVGLAELWPSNPVTRRHSGAGLDDHNVVAVDQPAGACVLVRRSDLDAIGGWDEGFWFWYEDVDLLRRLADRGQILYVPDATFRHLGGASLNTWGRAEVVRSRFTGMLRYASAHLPRRAQVGLAAVIVLVSLPRVLWFGLTRPEDGRAWRAVIGAALRLAGGRPPGKL